MHAVVTNCLDLLFEKLRERIYSSRPLKPLIVFSTKGLSKQFMATMANEDAPLAPACLSLEEFLSSTLCLFYPDLAKSSFSGNWAHLLEAIYDELTEDTSAFKGLKNQLDKMFQSSHDARGAFFDQIACLIRKLDLQSAADLVENKQANRSELWGLMALLYKEVKARGYLQVKRCCNQAPVPVFAHIAFVGFDRIDKGLMQLLSAIDQKALIEFYSLSVSMHYVADINRTFTCESGVIAAFGGEKKAFQTQLVDFGIETQSYFQLAETFQSEVSAEELLVDAIHFPPYENGREKTSVLDAYKASLGMFFSDSIKMDFTGDNSLSVQAFSSPVEEVKGLLHRMNLLNAKSELKGKSIRIYLAHPDRYVPILKALFSQYQIPYVLSCETSLSSPRLIDSFLYLLSFAEKRWSSKELASLFKIPYFLPHLSKDLAIEAFKAFCDSWKFSSGMTEEHKFDRSQTSKKDSLGPLIEGRGYYTLQEAVGRWAHQVVNAASGFIEQESISDILDYIQKLYVLLAPIRMNLPVSQAEASERLKKLLETFFSPGAEDHFKSDYDELKSKIEQIELGNMLPSIRMQSVVYQLKKSARTSRVQIKDHGVVICPLERGHLAGANYSCILGFDENALKDSGQSDLKDLLFEDPEYKLTFPLKNDLVLDLIMMTKEAIYFSHAERSLGKVFRRHPFLSLLQSDVKKSLQCTERCTHIDIVHQEVELPGEKISCTKLEKERLTQVNEASGSLPEEVKEVSLFDLRLLLSDPLRWYYKMHFGVDLAKEESPILPVSSESELQEVFDRGPSIYDQLVALKPCLENINPISGAVHSLNEKALAYSMKEAMQLIGERGAFSLELTPLRSTLVFTEQENMMRAFAPAIEVGGWTIQGTVRAASENGVIVLGKKDAKSQWLYASDALILKEFGFGSKILYLHENSEVVVSSNIKRLLKYAEFAFARPSLIYFDTFKPILNRDPHQLKQKLYDKAFGYQPDNLLAHHLNSGAAHSMEELIEELYPMCLEIRELFNE